MENGGENMQEEDKDKNIIENGILKTESEDFSISEHIIKTRLSPIQGRTIKQMMFECLDDPRDKKRLFAAIMKDIPEANNSNLGRLWREAKHEYYQNMKRIPSDALLNQINETNEMLTERILNESRRDITFQADVINKINVTAAQVNKLSEVAPVVNIMFHQPIQINELLNPNKVDIKEVSEINPEQNGKDK